MSRNRSLRKVATTLAIMVALVGGCSAQPENELVTTSSGVSSTIHLSVLGTYESGVINAGGAEISAYDPPSKRLFVVNAGPATIDVLDLSDPSMPTLLFSIPMAPFGGPANSVAVKPGGGMIAAAVEQTNKQLPGSVVFFDSSGVARSQVTVGALPDMLTFSPNGRYVLVANEGEPNDAYTVDPEGSVSVIDVSRGLGHIQQSDVRTADFHAFDNVALDPNIRVFGPNATVSQDLEPEYITISNDSRTAWVTLQEANAIAIVDIWSARVTHLRALGFKNHNLAGNGIDASDRDNMVNIQQWPVFGMYQPDTIDSYNFLGAEVLVTANEGDTRAWTGFNEEARVSTLNLDPTAFPNAAALKANAALGRLTVTNTRGDTDGDGDFDQLYAFGARSFSIWTPWGTRIWDSRDDFEQLTAELFPTAFNSDNAANNSFDTRSDNKGPEPEGLTLGQVRCGFITHTFAFVGLERVGGVMVYDITLPFAPHFVQYINNRDFAGDAAAGTAGDLGPEGLLFIKKSESPTHQPLLVVTNEISGTTTVYGID